MNIDILCYSSFQSPKAQNEASALANTVSKVWCFDCSIEKIIHTKVIHRLN